MFGKRAARRLQSSEEFRTGLASPDEQSPENEAIRNLLKEAGSEHAWYYFTEQLRVDLNGDGREDVVVQRVTGALDTRTDLFIFLRNADGKLPERPTQILHCSGFPMAIGPERKVSVVCDLDGDGMCELLVAAPKAVIASSSGIVEMIMSKGVNIAVNIRALHRGVYSKSPDASVDIIGALAPDLGAPELYILDGDFNGDGRKDLLIRRTLREWNVYFSSKLGTWFREKPALRLESPVDGSPEIQDLNGDGFSDLAVKAWEEPRIAIFLSRQ